MRISACYIVKNEEKNLPQSIASLQLAVDEIVVVDTGSTDRTREVAAAAGAKVYTAVWQDDFSGPRNMAVEQAAGDWILFLDADEAFQQTDGLRTALELMVQQHPDLDAVLFPRLNVEPSDGGTQSLTYDMRFFRRTEQIRYEGRIHEHIVKKGGKLNMQYAPKTLVILHTGYASAVAPVKAARNLAILQDEIRRGRMADGYEYYLADCYYGLKDYDQALLHARASIEGPVQMIGDESHMYHVLLECMRKRSDPLDDMLVWADRALQEFPLLPDYHAERGMILCGLGKLPEARQEFIEALLHYEQQDYPVRQGSYFSRTVAARVAARLGEIAEIFKDSGETQYWFRQAEQYSAADKVVQEKVRTFHNQQIHQQLEITACYIVRDEAEVLARSLESIQGQVDEIIVVDTGSVDESVAVAQRFGARIIQHPWQDDFSEARNTALAAAKGRWIVFLDADEYFTEETRGNLRQVIAGQHEAQLLLLSMKNIDIDTGRVLLEFYAPRIFCRAQGRIYVGSIHEQLRQDGGLVQPVQKVRSGELQLLHTGYSVRLEHQKAERNLHMLLRELSRTDTPEFYYMYLAETYDGLGKTEQAIHYAQLDIDSGRKSVTYASRSYRILLRLLSGKQGNCQRRLAVAARATADFPEVPEFHAEYAECLADSLDFAAAVCQASQAIEQAGNYQGLEPMEFDGEAVATLGHRCRIWQQVEQHKQDLRIAACVIVRNERSELPAWIANAREFADTCLVVDTGSTDGSVELARQVGCQVLEMVWQGDFAAARNYALANVEADWVTVLDADETFYHPEQVRAYLAMTDLVRPPLDAVLLPIRNVDADDEDREIKRAAHIRLIRLRPEIRYTGRVHEQLEKTSGKLAVFEEDHRLEIRHTGYSTGRIQQKLLRNLALLKQEIAEHGEQPGHARYLADCYYGLGDYERALQYAQKSLAGTAQSIHAQSDREWMILHCQQELEYPLAEQLSMARQAIAQYPQLPDFYGQAGLLLSRQGSCDDAVVMLEKACLLAEHPDGDRKEATQFGDLADAVYAELALLYEQRQEDEKAAAMVRQALKWNRHNEKALELFCLAQQCRPLSEQAAALKELCGASEESLRYLARFAANFGWLALFQIFAAELKQQFSVILPAQADYETLLSSSPAREELTGLIGDITADMQQLPVLLVRLEKENSIGARRLARKCRDMLPDAMQVIWQTYQQKGVLEQQDGYDLFWPAFLRWADDDAMEHFVLLARNFPTAKIYALARQLSEVERWSAALCAYGLIPAESEEAAGAEFWQDLGICFYELGERDTAQECLARALSLEAENPAIRAYQQWSREEHA